MLTALASAFVAVRRAVRFFSPTAWLIIGILAASLIFGAYCSHRAAEGERDRQASAAQPKSSVRPQAGGKPPLTKL